MKATEAFARLGELRGCGAAVVNGVTEVLAADTTEKQIEYLEQIADLAAHINQRANELRASLEAEQALGEIP